MMIKEIKFTENAIKQVNQLVASKKTGTYFRISVKGGGCSGLSYDLTFTPTEKGDTVIDHEGFKIFMDAKSLIYLKGMMLDYKGGLDGKGFVFVNPNATSTCGCGESFSIT